MTQNFQNYESIRFKNWIKKRFIAEIDFYSISCKDALLWCEALEELSDELIDTLHTVRFEHHQIVPFFRRGE